MKLNKNKNKAKNKIHPSPFSPSSSSLTPLNDSIKTLNLLLPATILTLISSLSLSDSEVLAYMLIHSLKSSTTIEKVHKRNNNNNNNNKLFSHCFECDCFDCYTNYWYRWDLSPHRELIHQAIEAFEEHLATNEMPKKGRRKEKIKKDPFLQVGIEKDPILEVGFQKDPILKVGFEKDPILEVSFENGWDPVEKRVGLGVGGGGDVEEREVCGGDVEGRESCGGDVEERGSCRGDYDVEERERRGSRGGGKLVLRGEEHRGLARKMLPDVIGLFNSRLWNLWGPNV